MKFKIIPNEQTPAIKKVIKITDIEKKHNLYLFAKFLSFARRQHNCAGLASNQVSLDGTRIDIPFFAIKDNRFWDVMINPTIVKYGGKPQKVEEGCLTWLGKTIITERFPEIWVSHYNLKGDYIERTITGFEAQVWQHEYNHLIGKEEVFK